MLGTFITEAQVALRALLPLLLWVLHPGLAVLALLAFLLALLQLDRAKRVGVGWLVPRVRAREHRHQLAHELVPELRAHGKVPVHPRLLWLHRAPVEAATPLLVIGRRLDVQQQLLANGQLENEKGHGQKTVGELAGKDRLPCHKVLQVVHVYADPHQSAGGEEGAYGVVDQDLADVFFVLVGRVRPELGGPIVHLVRPVVPQPRIRLVRALRRLLRRLHHRPAMQLLRGLLQHPLPRVRADEERGGEPAEGDLPDPTAEDEPDRAPSAGARRVAVVIGCGPVDGNAIEEDEVAHKGSDDALGDELRRLVVQDELDQLVLVRLVDDEEVHEEGPK
mmetsp:Transcript_51819/g.150720  ORF Transcript_51819/g.150720 Transcript_51819/m.150720 type:complete len:335 (-) Transcript_51819:727-1731(-)